MNKYTIKILLVEDNKGDVGLIKEALKDVNAATEIVVCEDGEEAINYLTAPENRPDLILLDLNLPKKSGKEVLQELKSNPKLKTIPIIVLTSSESEKDIQSAYDLGANSYLTKPVDFDNFMESIGSFEKFWLALVKLPKK